jgi:dTDP-4-amino-4,6-dideoxygalactose transaminase
MPSTEELLPYLKEIESNGIYSNFGPLVLRLEEKLAEYFSVRIDQVTTLTNATIALEGAIQTSSSLQETWGTPSWTFPASNLALERCGVPYEFLDVDKDWRVLPNNNSVAVLDVCAFGDSLALSRFKGQYQTIIVDAAGSFPSLKNCGKILSQYNSQIGIVVSFHPTKVLPGIEGGVFISNQANWVSEVRMWSRFGMEFPSRNSKKIGTNAKMSEFQAAVILASIEKSPYNFEKWRNLHSLAREISTSVGINTHPAMASGHLSTYWIVESTARLTKRLESLSKVYGFETRRWWEYGCHKMSAFSRVPYKILDNTEKISNSSIGLPFFLNMTEREFELILNALSEAIE